MQVEKAAVRVDHDGLAVFLELAAIVFLPVARTGMRVKTRELRRWLLSGVSGMVISNRATRRTRESTNAAGDVPKNTVSN